MRFSNLISCFALWFVAEAAYKSSSAVRPRLKITRSGQPLSPGYFVFTHQANGNLLANDGELIYQGKGGANFHISKLHDKQILSYYKVNQLEHGFSFGHTVIKDNTYKKLYVVCPELGLNGLTGPAPKCQGDLHESLVTNRGTLVVSAYNVTRGDLSSIGGPKNGWVIDGQFYEIDIVTNEILFSWSSLDHVPVSNTYAPIGNKGTKQANAFDYFHINSIQPVPGGSWLVSGRDVSSVYMIGSDGSVIWDFNGHGAGTFGTLPSLPNGKPANFAVQHDARLRKVTSTGAIIHFFNDANPMPSGKKRSTGMEWELNTQTNTSKLLRNLRDNTMALTAFKEGSYNEQPDGNVVLGYGNVPYIQEFGPTGNVDVRISIDLGEGDYRSSKAVWHAVPYYPPSVVVESGVGYVSWNGATDVTNYVIYAAASRANLRKVGSIRKTLFENSFDIPTRLQETGGYVKVAAYEGTTLLRNSSVLEFGAQR